MKCINKFSVLKWPCLLLLFLGSVPCFSQQEAPISLQATPGALFPLGPSLEDGSQLYSVGGYLGLTATYILPFAKLFSANGRIEYSLVPTTSSNNLSLISLGIGPGVCYSPISRLDLTAAVVGGGALGLYKGITNGSLFFAIDTMASYTLTPAFSLGLGASYKHFFGPANGSISTFFNGIGVSLGATYTIGAGSHRSKVEFREIRIDPVFPVFYKYYDTNPLGRLILSNRESGAIRNVRVRFFVSQYMDQPKLCAVIPEMKSGEEIEVSLNALFNEKILDITEMTKATAEVRVEYTLAGMESTGNGSDSLRIYDRNAMAWDDNQKAASFVTAKDPAVMRLSKNVASLVRHQGSSPIDLSFRSAMAIFKTLSLYGLNYVVDPKTPFTQMSGKPSESDYLQFPIQTLTYKAGDCDDLSILYAALLESVGIETAFITVPGHIFVAFALSGTDPDEVGKSFSKGENLIRKADQVWVPVEITMVQEGFLKAWETGASEWRDADRSGTAGFYPIHDAWKLYEPVSLVMEDKGLQFPEDDEVNAGFSQELSRFVQREIAPQVADLQQKIARAADKDKAPLVNKLGAVFARYGLLDKAAEQFGKLSGKSPYTPALVNLGNLYFMKKEVPRALEWFNRALQREPQNRKALIGCALAHYEQQNLEAARLWYGRAARLDPAIADRYAFIAGTAGDESQRASADWMKEKVLWDDK